MEDFVSPEWKEFAGKIILANSLKLRDLFVKYNISQVPTPENIMLAVIKFKDPFIEELAELAPIPSELMHADGGSTTSKIALLGIIVKALDVTNGAGTAAKLGVAGATSGLNTGSDKGSENKSENPEDSFNIFGKSFKKKTVYIVVGIIVLGVGYLIYKKNNS